MVILDLFKLIFILCHAASPLKAIWENIVQLFPSIEQEIQSSVPLNMI